MFPQEEKGRHVPMAVSPAILEASGANGGLAKPRIDGLIRQWCPSSSELEENDASDAGRPHPLTAATQQPRVLLN